MRIVLDGVGADSLIEARVESVDCFEDRDWRAVGASGVAAKKLSDASNKGDDLVSERGGARNDEERDHLASRATPQATRKAPAHRAGCTSSCKRKRASSVSTTTLAAVAGTAKLKSSSLTSSMKQKNEMAMKKTETRMGQR